jgi:putative peptidoglycan lipid II flippase
MGGVLLPKMSTLAAKNDTVGMGDTIRFGVRQLLFVCVPAAAFTFICRGELIQLLFMRGAFDRKAFEATSWALAFYSLGIPFFAIIKVAVSGFHARKEMDTPVKISIFCISVNLILNLILMWPLQQGGIALATVISSILNNFLLLLFLRKRLDGFKPEKSLADFARILVSCAPAILAVSFLSVNVKEFVENLTFALPNGAEVAPLALIFGITYLITSMLFNRRELKEWFEMLLRR